MIRTEIEIIASREEISSLCKKGKERQELYSNHYTDKSIATTVHSLKLILIDWDINYFSSSGIPRLTGTERYAQAYETVGTNFSLPENV